MRITTNYESPLVLKNIMITDGIFKRTEDSLENVELRVNVAHNIEQLSEVEYKITLELSVADPEGKLSVFVKGITFDQHFIFLFCFKHCHTFYKHR